MRSGYCLGVQAQFFFLATHPPSPGGMEYLRQHRSDVYTEDHLDRYEQFLDILMIHTIFGMGALQSVWFLTFLTIDDVCIFNAPALQWASNFTMYWTTGRYGFY